MKKLRAFFSSLFKKQKSFSSLFSEAVVEGMKEGLKEIDEGYCKE